MKCPSCTSHHKVKWGLTCSCGYQFCFNPQSDGITDGQFLAAVNLASRNGTCYFTENQLHAALAHKMRRNVLGCVTSTILAGLAGWLMVLEFGPLSGGAAGFAVLMASSAASFGAVSREKMQSWIDHWTTKCEKTLEKMIREPRLHEPPPEWREPDIYDYGVEGLLLVERNELVDLFVLNNYHSTQRLLILSENGYPDYLVPHAVRILNENPNLPVYLLHDSTPHGTEMEARIRQWETFPIEGHPVTDLGMSPDDVRRVKRLNALRLEQNHFAVPVDLLMFGGLAAGLTAAIAGNATFGDLITGSPSHEIEWNDESDGDDFG